MCGFFLFLTEQAGYVGFMIESTVVSDALQADLNQY